MSSFIIKRPSRSSLLLFSKIRNLVSSQILPDSSLSDAVATDASSASGFTSILSRNLKTSSGLGSIGSKNGNFSHSDRRFGVLASGFRQLSSEAASVAEEATEPSTSDGLTVEKIIANQWTILNESESDWKSHAAAIAQSIQVIKRRLQWEKLLVRVNLLSAELNKPDLWNDPTHAGKICREHGSLMGKMKEVKAFERELLDHIDMLKLARDENDSELESETLKVLVNMRRLSKEKELEALLSGDNDSCSCYIEVQAGAGGTESMDWASMVMQMYKMWAQRRGFSVSIVDEMPGDMAGIKRATIKVDGEYAFGYAKAEVGVHRLVRMSPFDSGQRRHTSFAAVAVIPILGDGSARVHINESDLRIERFRSGGPGGQHANTTESAVRITHTPTGITATSQSERSQHMNKASAMAVLQSRLDQLEMSRQAAMNAEHTQSLTEISWGNQIRTYVLHPYRMVKDLRTNYEVSDPDSVLEGDLDGFILSYLSASLDEDNNEQ
ncbi:PREDICTED: peptide chain release factor PrfB2, chloroplastic [Tarenaya hassleriana]|uniref:peptide chain release factor PrfB2, chloroplastic n=1 Tax=Tarenaya hassleriana TaxID=28532 RepID=UPI00053C08AF|nr:PREDICTED: peptide chain release factor PrfB2, chloroplastic [Tarenaya hassleriana]